MKEQTASECTSRFAPIQGLLLTAGLLLTSIALLVFCPSNAHRVAGAKRHHTEPTAATEENPALAGRVLGVQCQYAHVTSPTDNGVPPVKEGGDNPEFWLCSTFGWGTQYIDEQQSFRNVLIPFPYDWFLNVTDAPFGAVWAVRSYRNKFPAGTPMHEKYENFVGTDKYDSVLGDALEKGIEDNLLALLCRRVGGQKGDGNLWRPHKQLEQWATAARKVAFEYGKAIKYYEIWDEPGLDTPSGFPCFDGDVFTDYPPVLQRAYHEIKKGEAECGGGSSTVISGSLLHSAPYIFTPDPKRASDGIEGIEAIPAFDVYRNMFNHIGSGPPEGGEDVSIVASSSNPFVAERPIYFSFNDYKKNGGPALEETATVNRRGGHVAAGYPVTTEPGGSSTWYFAEGCTRADLGMEEYICVYNPNDEEIRVGRRYSGSDEFKGGYAKNKDGTYTYDEARKLIVPAHKRGTIPVHDPNEAGLNQDVSVCIEGFVPGKDRPYAPIPKNVFAERVLYFNFRGFSGGHCAVGRPTKAKSWYFAEGTTRTNHADQRYETYICIQNPDSATATCKLTYMPTNGENMSETVSIPPNSRYTVCPVNVLDENVDFSTYILSDAPVVAERPMYFSLPNGINDGSVEVGATTPRKDFYFAEGATYHDIQEYLCIQNPNPSPADVTLHYMTERGEKQVPIKVEARSRFTVDVNADVGQDHDVSVHVQSTKPVVAERPMYFNYDSKRDEVFIPQKQNPAEIAIRYGGGHVSSGIATPAKKYVFAEGLAGHYFEEYICLQNPNEDAIDVTLDFYSKWGKCWSKTYHINGYRRETVRVFEELALFNCCDAVGIHLFNPPYDSDGNSWVRGYRLLRNLMNDYQYIRGKELIVASCGWPWGEYGPGGAPRANPEAGYDSEKAKNGLEYAPSGGMAGINGLLFEAPEDRCKKVWYFMDIDGPYKEPAPGKEESFNDLYGLYDRFNNQPSCVWYWSDPGYEGGYKKWQEAIPDTPELDPNEVLPQR
ncbi:MAG: hypothetical protein KKF41_11810 [Actinobacteria bacterium]|nr:hypothetical protein [Actinomycetota bacterium]MBU1944393.1 hypothetical protein [Actinomycetota bacterium]MBU2688261.1 hypothetical protein [Actinomycetota bacterium]